MRTEDFGMAFLRGWEFKEEEGIGKTNKRVVNITQQEKRAKNLGLGAKITAEDDLKPGSKVLIISGSFKDKYGIIESIDGDNARCFIKLAITKEIVSISQINVKLLSVKEYESNSRVLNKKAFDAAAHEIHQPLIEKSIDKRQATVDQEVIKQSNNPTPPPPSRPWAVENLRVRIINKQYMNGKYYKSKMVVIEANDQNECILQDNEGQKHELKEKWIETVIPKGKGGNVMVLEGKYRGSLGQIVDRDDEKYKLSVAVHESDDIIINVDFDHACEYVGYVQEE